MLHEDVWVMLDIPPADCCSVCEDAHVEIAKLKATVECLDDENTTAMFRAGAMAEEIHELRDANSALMDSLVERDMTISRLRNLLKLVGGQLDEVSKAANNYIEYIDRELG